jgi:PAS domain S-box-containing protein
MQRRPADSPERIERMLALLAEQATEHAILLLNRAGRVIWWSKGAERTFALAREQALGMEFDRIFTPQDARAGISALELAIADSNAIAEDDRWHKRADDSTFWSSGALIAIRDANGELLGFGKIIRDRTDLKTHLTLLENHLAAAQQLVSDRDVLVTKMTHELRNVVAGIDAGLELLRSAQTDEPKRERVAVLMQQQLRVLRRLTEDLLEIRRLQTAKTQLILQDVVVQDVLRDVVDEMQPRTKQKSQDLQLLCSSAPIEVAGDPVRLHQIFANLLDNAIKYTPSGGRIWVKATIEDRFGVIHLEDTGQGIPPEMLTRIFELFTQVDAGASGGGLGIGLALVHELVQLHGGSVEALSKGIGLGSEFSVRLPLKGAASDLARPGKPDEQRQL